MQRGARNVVLDFSEVSHLDYRGVKPLMARVEALPRAGGDVKLSGPVALPVRHLPGRGRPRRLRVLPALNDARAAFALARAPFV